MTKPFDGAITKYYESGAPKNIRKAVRKGKKNDVLAPNFPYKKRMDRDEYDTLYAALQIELVKMQSWIIETNQRIAIVFEGRDGAGKGGTIYRFGEHLNPRGARVVALAKPTPRESSQWYFQRYVQHLPSAGELVFFDRSWYNRAVIEPVFGFCTPEQNQHFYNQAPGFEDMLVEDGITLIKIWLTVGRAEQLRRLLARESDPLKQWKLSGIDVKGLELRDEYSTEIERMFKETDTETSPWNVIRSDDKRRARIAAIRLVLAKMDYDGKDHDVVTAPDPEISGSPAIMGLEVS